MDKLNIGCGNIIKPGWINLDLAKLPGVDVVYDIEKIPLPFEDNQFEEILCEDVIEHIEYIPVLRDFYRILKPGGKITIRVPHFTSAHNFRDPTHKKMFSIATFDFFVKKTFEANERGYYFDFSFNKCIQKKIIFETGSVVYFFNPIIEWLVNISPTMQKIYEGTWLSRIFPACNIFIILEK